MPWKTTRKKYNILIGKEKVSKKRGHPERDMQESFVEWFRKKYPYLATTEDGEPGLLISTHGESLLKNRRLILMGACRGVADMLLSLRLGNYAGLYIEFKCHPRKASKEQVVFMKMAEIGGYKTELCYSCQEGMKAIEDYFDQDRGALAVIYQELFQFRCAQPERAKPKWHRKDRR